MPDLTVVTTSDRHDLDDEAAAAFRPGWPEFVFHDPVVSEYIGRVEDYFPSFDIMVLDAGQVVAGGWGVPLAWDGTVPGLPPDGYDGALVRAVDGYERDIPADTLCIMAAAVRADRQGAGLASRTLTALRERATAAGLGHVIAPVRRGAEEPLPAHPDGRLRPLVTRGRAAHRPVDPHPPAAWRGDPGARPALDDHLRHGRRVGAVDRDGLP